ncbi:MAG: Os1348 family NHLP clan protein [Chloroflexota bacterium]
MQTTIERTWVLFPVAAAPAKEADRKKVILEVLARAADDSHFLARLAENPAEALSEYYTLTQEEVAALVNGDIRKIENWLGKLDKRHATWLWCRLSQEKW